MIRKFILIASILTYSCACQRFSDNEISTNRKIFSFAREVKYTDHLEICLFGGSELNGQTNSISLAFFSHDPVTIDQARELYINILNRFIDSINSDPRIRQFLAVYPFTKDQIDLMILFDPPIDNCDIPYISGMGMGPIDGTERNFIYIGQTDPSTGDVSAALVEPYNKALNKLRFQQHQQEMDAELQAQGCL